MKKTVLFITALLLMGSTAGAQGLLGRLGERAKNAVEENIGNKVEQGVNDILNGKKKDKKNKGKEEEQAAEAAPAPEEQPAVSKPAKSIKKN